MSKITLILCCLIAIGSHGESQKVSKRTTDSLVIPSLNVDSNGNLVIRPSSSSSNNDFDFFAGKWKVHNRMLKKKPDGTIEWKEFEATQEMHIVLRGIGNVDNFLAERNGRPFEGMTVRLFNPKTRLWSIYWADSNFGDLGLPPQVGSFENKVGYFFSRSMDHGQSIITVYRWDARDANNPVWSQTVSNDNGQTWQDWNWTMYMHKME